MLARDNLATGLDGSRAIIYFGDFTADAGSASSGMFRAFGDVVHAGLFFGIAGRYRPNFI